MAAQNLVDRLAAVRETIDRSLTRAGRRHAVTIVAVTKTHPADAVHEALAAGWGTWVRTGCRKRSRSRMRFPVSRFAGTSSARCSGARPARHGRFSLIHSVDRADLAGDLARRVVAGTGKRVLAQVNCSAEPQKGGVEPAALPQLIDDVLALPALELCGLMTMAAFDAEEPELRRTFGLLRAPAE
jgi:uncharacterized pyridoxal phosphate-containing UPF0001 family protein